MLRFMAVLSGTLEDEDAFGFLSEVLDEVGVTDVDPPNSAFESPGDGRSIAIAAFNASMYDLDGDSRTPTLCVWHGGDGDALLELASSIRLSLTVAEVDEATGAVSGNVRQWIEANGYDQPSEFDSVEAALGALFDARLHASVDLAECLELR